MNGTADKEENEAFFHIFQDFRRGSRGWPDEGLSPQEKCRKFRGMLLSSK